MVEHAGSSAPLCRLEGVTRGRGERRRFNSSLPNILLPQSLLQVREGVQGGIARRWVSVALVLDRYGEESEKPYLRSIGNAWASEQKEMKLGMEASRVTCHDADIVSS